MRSTSACAVAAAAEGAGADVLSVSDGVSVSSVLSASDGASVSSVLPVSVSASVSVPAAEPGMLPLSVSADSAGRAAVLPEQAAVRDSSRMARKTAHLFFLRKSSFRNQWE